MQQLNQVKNMGNCRLDSFPLSDPSFKLSKTTPTNTYLYLIRGTEDWIRTKYEKDYPFEQDKIPIGLMDNPNWDTGNSHQQALISQAEIESFFKDKGAGSISIKDAKVFSIGTLGFDDAKLEIELECLLQHLAFSGSFSTFHLMLKEWGNDNPTTKSEIFGRIFQIFKESEELKKELYLKSIMYGKNESYYSFFRFMKSNFRNEKYALSNEYTFTVVIEPNRSNRAVFLNKLSIRKNKINKN